MDERERTGPEICATDAGVETPHVNLRSNEENGARNLLSAQHLPDRRVMMQAWADYLDGLCTSGSTGEVGSHHP